MLAGNDGRRGYIYHTAVHPKWRRQRVASQLITTALNALKHIGIHETALVVFTKNKDGNAFWENEGITSATK
ncbi:GNAT family N-acetyltransferase [Treponema medium]|uniref:GNAT family N-acetyltransferase n=1 Tax=Treponema medium TaxID=58231 RepID=A0ABX7LXR8_TREMD|nr:GNAT family N-acetyltransferase [Treponema medium]